MIDMVQVGLRIKEARIERGYTQEELGKALGLNKSTIQRYETGQIIRPKLPVLQAIAQQLGVNPSWLVLQDENKKLLNKPQVSGSSSDTEKELLLLARHLEKIPDEQRKKIINNFKNSIDVYLSMLEQNDDKTEDDI